MACARAPPGPQIPSTSRRLLRPPPAGPPLGPSPLGRFMGKWTREQRPSSGHQPRVPHLSPVRGPSAVLGEPASPRPLPPAARAKLPSLPPPPGLRVAFSAPRLLGSPRLRSLWAPRSAPPTPPPSGFRLYSASCTSAIWVGCRECPWPRGSGRFIRRWWTRRSFSFWGVTIKNTA